MYAFRIHLADFNCFKCLYLRLSLPSHTTELMILSCVLYHKRNREEIDGKLITPTTFMIINNLYFVWIVFKYHFTVAFLLYK